MATAFSKYEQNVFRAEAISEIAQHLSYRLEDVHSCIESYRNQIAEAKQANPEAGCRWEERNLEAELQKEAIYNELFKALDKMM